MSFGLMIVASQTNSGEAEWVTRFDPDAHPEDAEPGDYPTGDGACDPDPAKALRFESAREAREFWMQTSAFTPTRPDGRPNRPLTAFTITIEKIPSTKGTT